MRGRTLEEIDELFQNRVPTREFPKYHCLSGERAREQALKNVGVHEDAYGASGDGDKKKTIEIEQREIAV